MDKMIVVQANVSVEIISRIQLAQHGEFAHRLLACIAKVGMQRLVGRGRLPRQCGHGRLVKFISLQTNQIGTSAMRRPENGLPRFKRCAQRRPVGLAELRAVVAYRNRSFVSSGKHVGKCIRQALTKGFAAL